MSIEDKFLIPLHGLNVKDPISKQPLAQEGEYKPYYGSAAARYWRRRIRAGSIKIGTPPKLKKDEKISSLKKSDGRENKNKFIRKREDVENGD